MIFEFLGIIFPVLDRFRQELTEKYSAADVEKLQNGNEKRGRTGMAAA